MTLARWGRAAEAVVAWLDGRGIGPVLRTLCGLLVLGLPAAREYQMVRSPLWLAAFFASAVLLIPLTHYHQGAPVTRLTRKLAALNGSFGGTLELLRARLAASPGRRLRDEHCELLCSALLHLIREFTAVALQPSERVRLRATLAVPISTMPGGPIDALRVWCYDRPPDSPVTAPMPLERDGEPASVVASAYLTCEMSLGALDPPARTSLASVVYRSTVAFPLAARGNNGLPLAVVTLDTDAPDFFIAHEVGMRALPLLSPSLHTLGLILSLRKESAYVFSD